MGVFLSLDGTCKGGIMMKNIRIPYKWFAEQKCQKRNEELYKGKPIKFVIEEFARENNLKVVMHFPHSSLEVAASFWKDVDIDKAYFTKINLLMSDLFLLDLFKDWNYEKVIAPYSRLYVDVEKYWNDAEEVMSKYGMGAIYTKDINGQPLHKKTSEFVEEAKRYYEEHHRTLSKACEGDQDVLILDMHSFNFRMSRFVTNKLNLPDVCLGVNDDGSRSDDLLRKIKVWNKANKAFRFRINYPYKGSIMPNKKRNGQRIYSLMFEFNKKWYL